jgi:hypothetical protein
MGLPDDAAYVAYDIDTRLPELLGLLDAAVPQRVSCRCLDLAAEQPRDEADVAFLMKISTTLERQEPGSTARLLLELPARHVVVSFPTASLGGRTKGMTATYERFMEGVLADTSLDAVRLRRAEEIFYVVATRMGEGTRRTES